MSRFPFLVDFGAGAAHRWRLWALFAAVTLVAAMGTYVSGQYKIGRLDMLKNKYDQSVQNYAGALSSAQKHSLEFDLLEGCKQNQIGTWLQTTEALRFRGPVTGNRVDVSLDESKAFLDLNGREISTCIQGDIEDLQYDIGSMVNSWAVILLLASFCLGVWSWVCYAGHKAAHKTRNIYAETLAEATTGEEASPVGEVKTAEEPPVAAPSDLKPDQ